MISTSCYCELAKTKESNLCGTKNSDFKHWTLFRRKANPDTYKQKTDSENKQETGCALTQIYDDVVFIDPPWCWLQNVNRFECHLQKNAKILPKSTS